MTGHPDLALGLFPISAKMKFSLTPFNVIENQFSELSLVLNGGYAESTSYATKKKGDKRDEFSFAKVFTSFDFFYNQGFFKNQFGNDLLYLKVGLRGNFHIAIDALEYYFSDSNTLGPVASFDFINNKHLKELSFKRQYLSLDFYTSLVISNIKGEFGANKGVSASLDFFAGFANLANIKKDLHYFYSGTLYFNAYLPFYKINWFYNKNKLNLFAIGMSSHFTFKYSDGSYLPSFYFQPQIIHTSATFSLNIIGPQIILTDTYPTLTLSYITYLDLGPLTNNFYQGNSTTSGALFNLNLNMKLFNVFNIFYQGEVKIDNGAKWEGGFGFYVDI